MAIVKEGVTCVIGTKTLGEGGREVMPVGAER